jgi:hypothetical protein
VNLRRALIAVGCAAVLIAIVLAFLPVSIEPSSVLPGPLQDLLPQAFRVAETSCGSVARPHRPAGFGGVLSSIATLLDTECTHAVRARLWMTVWLGLGGLAVLLMGLLGFDRRRRSRPIAGTPFAPPHVSPPGSAPSARAVTAIHAGLATVVIAVLTSSLVACGSTGQLRSPAAFCSVLKSEQTRILNQLDATSSIGANSSDGFSEAVFGLGASLQALGELRTYFHKLSAVAPPEVETEAQLVAEWYDDQVKAAADIVNDPLGTIAGSLFSTLMISGQLNTLNTFALQECGQSV